MAIKFIFGCLLLFALCESFGALKLRFQSSIAAATSVQAGGRGRSIVSTKTQMVHSLVLSFNRQRRPQRNKHKRRVRLAKLIRRLRRRLRKKNRVNRRLRKNVRKLRRRNRRLRRGRARWHRRRRGWRNCCNQANTCSIKRSDAATEEQLEEDDDDEVSLETEANRMCDEIVSYVEGNGTSGSGLVNKFANARGILNRLTEECEDANGNGLSPEDCLQNIEVYVKLSQCVNIAAINALDDIEGSGDKVTAVNKALEDFRQDDIDSLYFIASPQVDAEITLQLFNYTNNYEDIIAFLDLLASHQEDVGGQYTNEDSKQLFEKKVYICTNDEFICSSYSKNDQIPPFEGVYMVYVPPDMRLEIYKREIKRTYHHGSAFPVFMSRDMKFTILEDDKQKSSYPKLCTSSECISLSAPNHGMKEYPIDDLFWKEDDTKIMSIHVPEGVQVELVSDGKGSVKFFGDYSTNDLTLCANMAWETIKLQSTTIVDEQVYKFDVDADGVLQTQSEKINQPEKFYEECGIEHDVVFVDVPEGKSFCLRNKNDTYAPQEGPFTSTNVMLPENRLIVDCENNPTSAPYDNGIIKEKASKKKTGH